MSLYFLWNFLLTPYQEPFDVGSASSSDLIYTEVEQSSTEYNSTSTTISNQEEGRRNLFTTYEYVQYLMDFNKLLYKDACQKITSILWIYYY